MFLLCQENVFVRCEVIGQSCGRQDSLSASTLKFNLIFSVSCLFLKTFIKIDQLYILIYYSLNLILILMDREMFYCWLIVATGHYHKGGLQVFYILSFLVKLTWGYLADTTSLTESRLTASRLRRRKVLTRIYYFLKNCI